MEAEKLKQFRRVIGRADWTPPLDEAGAWLRHVHELIRLSRELLDAYDTARINAAVDHELTRKYDELARAICDEPLCHDDLVDLAKDGSHALELSGKDGNEIMELQDKLRRLRAILDRGKQYNFVTPPIWAIRLKPGGTTWEDYQQ